MSTLRDPTTGDLMLSVTDELGDRYRVPVHEVLVSAGDACHVAYSQLPDGGVERQPDVPPQGVGRRQVHVAHPGRDLDHVRLAGPDLTAYGCAFLAAGLVALMGLRFHGQAQLVGCRNPVPPVMSG